MNQSSLHDYCLQTMGITQWQKRIPKPAIENVIFIDAALNSEQEQLMTKILQALKWPASVSTIQVVSPNESKETLLLRIKEKQPKRCLFFGEGYRKMLGDVGFNHIQIAIVPSLQEMLINQAAKKQAWKIMQIFVS